MAARDFLSEKDKADILVAISDAEAQTSGEIRLHVESRCKGDVLDRAAAGLRDAGHAQDGTPQRGAVLPRHRRTGSLPSSATAASTRPSRKASGTT